MAELLVQNRQRAYVASFARGPCRGSRSRRLILYAGDRVDKNFRGIVVGDCLFVEQRLVVKNFQVAGRKLLGAQQSRLGFVIFSQVPVKLRHTQKIFRGAGFQLGEAFILLQRFGVFVLRHQSLRQTVNVRRVVRILLHGLAVGLFGFRVFFRLGIRVAQQIVDVRRSRFPRRLGQQRNGFLGAPFILTTLGQQHVS